MRHHAGRRDQRSGWQAAGDPARIDSKAEPGDDHGTIALERLMNPDHGWCSLR